MTFDIPHSPDNEHFVGPQVPQELAEHIFRSRGPSGLNLIFVSIASDLAILGLGATYTKGPRNKLVDIRDTPTQYKPDNVVLDALVHNNKSSSIVSGSAATVDRGVSSRCCRLDIRRWSQVDRFQPGVYP